MKNNNEMKYIKHSYGIGYVPRFTVKHQWRNGRERKPDNEITSNSTVKKMVLPPCPEDEGEKEKGCGCCEEWEERIKELERVVEILNEDIWKYTNYYSFPKINKEKR